jgi:hypothetical protein
VLTAVLVVLVGACLLSNAVILLHFRRGDRRHRRVERQLRTGGTTPEQPEPVESAIAPATLLRARAGVRAQLKHRYPGLTKAQYAAAEDEIVIKGVQTLGRL